MDGRPRNTKKFLQVDTHFSGIPGAEDERDVIKFFCRGDSDEMGSAASQF